MSVFYVDMIKMKAGSHAGKREGFAVERIAGTFSTRKGGAEAKASAPSQIRAWHGIVSFSDMKLVVQTYI